MADLDVNGATFNVGDRVQVRGTVTAITAPGSGGRVTVAVDVAGNAGEATGVTMVVSPVQCRKAGEV